METQAGVQIIYGENSAPVPKSERLGVVMPEPVMVEMPGLQVPPPEPQPTIELGDHMAMVANNKDRIIQHYGEIPPILPPVTLFGVDLPLWSALEMIVPEGWQVFADKTKVNIRKRTEWNIRDQTWIEALYSIAVSHELYAEVDWKKRLVAIHQREVLVDNFKPDVKQELVNVTLENGMEIPEGAEGILIINGKAMKIRKDIKSNWDGDGGFSSR